LRSVEVKSSKVKESKKFKSLRVQEKGCNGEMCVGAGGELGEAGGFGFGGEVEGDVGVGVFPEGEEILVGVLRLRCVSG